MAEPLQHYTLATPIGVIQLAMHGERVQRIDLFAQGKDQQRAPALGKGHPVHAALAQYFRDPRHRPDLPLELEGTRFQKRLWRALQRIPVGETRTYGELAQQLNTSARAVGNACRANPLPLLIPCHRVVAANDMGGFAGARSGPRARVKQWLLRHEAGPRASR